MGPWACLVLSLWVGPEAARAPAPAPVTAAEPAAIAPAILVGVAQAIGVTDAEVLAVLRSHLAQTGLDVRVVTMGAAAEASPEAWADAAGDEVRAVFWLVPEGEGAVRLQLWLPGDAGAWGRTLPTGDDPDALLESVGVMVRTMAMSIEPDAPESEPIRPATGTPDARAPTPPHPTAPRAPDVARTHVDLALGYVGTSIAREVPWHSAVGVRAHVVTPRRLTAMVGVAWAPPQGARTTPSSTLERVAVDVGLGATLRPRARVRPVVGGAVVLEAIGWRVRGVAQGRGWAARVGVAATGGLDVAITPRLGVVALGRVDAWARNATLALESAGGRRTLLRAHPVAATVWAGARLRLGGTFLHPPRTGRRHEGG